MAIYLPKEAAETASDGSSPNSGLLTAIRYIATKEGNILILSCRSRTRLRCSSMQGSDMAPRGNCA